MTADHSTAPRATYRVQLHAGFTLDNAAEIVDYLAGLGVSHLYCSPYLQAAPGSTHGYDVVDPRQVNEELGGEAALDRLDAALRARQMGQVLDIVPNHMSIASARNPWWWDVLENGPSSRYASYFDVDWDPPEARHSNEVLIPILGDHYGRVLEAGDLRLALEDGLFTIRYFDNAYPLDPGTLREALLPVVQSSRSDDLAFIAGAYGRLPASAATDRASAHRRYRDTAVLLRLFQRLLDEQPRLRAAIERAVAAINQDPDALDRLLERQNYRLVFWRMAGRELGYRRFFDINTLIGLRMEDEQVFTDTHARILEWVQAGRLDGLRVDHPDGLLDPEEYLQRLRQAVGPQTWIVIEKILEPGEALPHNWPVQGTVGYDFLQRVNRLLVDPGGEDALNDTYTQFTGRSLDFPTLGREKKLLVLDEILGSDVNRLTHLLLQIIARHRRYRDYTLDDLRAALSELAADLPVYRTYVCARASLAERPISPADDAAIDQAVETAKTHRPDLDPLLLDFLSDLLHLRQRGEMEDEWVMRFQQMTGPAMAKGVEDTAFYNFYRLASLNEVGGDPGLFALDPAEFHRQMAEAGANWPESLLATSTHDTKRSEDVRARLNVLSEISKPWAQAVARWAEMNAACRQGDAPDPNDEYLLYQSLVGAWPIPLDRIGPYMQKAAREAKVHTAWTTPNPVYETALEQFVSSVMGNQVFLDDLERFVGKIREAGWVNSLAQTLIKLTTPGVPDLYQGMELWDYSLVDPDNRRPVDYDLRRKLLAELDGLTGEQAWARAESGLPKLWLTRQALHLRRAHPDWFGPASQYAPLETANDPRGQALAYQRGQHVVVVAPRFWTRRGKGWNDIQVRLPRGRWRNLLSGEKASGGEARLADLLARFPAALLVK